MGLGIWEKSQGGEIEEMVMVVERRAIVSGVKRVKWNRNGGQAC